MITSVARLYGLYFRTCATISVRLITRNSIAFAYLIALIVGIMQHYTLAFRFIRSQTAFPPNLLTRQHTQSSTFFWGRYRLCALGEAKDRGATFSTVAQIESLVSKAIEISFGDRLEGAVDPLIFLGKPDFGDYQCNAAMPLAKKLKMKPRDIADELMIRIKAEDCTDAPLLNSLDVSGPGFINMHLSQDFISRKALEMLPSSKSKGKLGVRQVREPKRVIVDFSSPNIAKEMHVGHLRSTIIGDCLSRVLHFQGHEVLRLNHVGDWGTQFGMLIHHLKTKNTTSGEEVAIGDLAMFYKEAKRRFDSDEVFKEESRLEVVNLQQGSSDSLKAWGKICETSRLEFQEIYNKLNISEGLIERGESFYNSMLPGLCDQLEAAGHAQQSDGALCVFLEGYNNADGTPLPLIIRKSDGGYLYATTDLAALQHRAYDENADRIIYVTDAGQAQHFQMVFKAAKLSKIIPPNVTVEHVPFGLVLGEDGKKIKSRSGDSIKLRELLDEAIRAAEEQFAARENVAADNSSVSDKDKARVLGIAAVKYADLAMNRESNYKFSFKKMLSLSGNTAPYMLYAYVRIRGIQRKVTGDQNDNLFGTEENLNQLSLQETAELNLAKHLIRFDAVIEEVASELYPHKLCDYIFELSQKFNKFYENCPVLRAATPEVRKSRAILCTLTAEVLKTTLELLGIDTLERL